MNIHVSQSGDKVILDLGGRRRDVLLRPILAVKLAGILEEKAALAETVPTLPEIHTKVWNLTVMSHEGCVVIYIRPPEGTTTSRIEMPAWAARELARQCRLNAQWAGYQLRLAPPDLIDLTKRSIERRYPQWLPESSPTA